MGGRILILGAAGRLGRAAALAFREAGWTVVSLVRPGAAWRADQDTIVVEDDGLHTEAVLEAAPGAHVVLHALNPPYVAWAREAVPMAEVAIAAAEKARATLLFPGNVYNYGKAMPLLIDEETPMQPTARKGALRVEIERRLKAASERGVRVIVLRAGDFFGGAGRGSWFDLVIARDLSLNLVRYPGPLNVVHAWAYLPDYAKTLVKLAEMRGAFAPYETFGFPGHAVTGAEFLSAIEGAVGRDLRRKSFPWLPIHLFRFVVKHWGELSELAYLWRKPHRVSGNKLEVTIGEIPHTPLQRAIATTLDPLSR